MYTSFRIESFRCFKQLAIEPLARVNLIAGKNNVGKTTLLEALWAHSGPNLPDIGVRLSGFRGIPRPDPRRLLHDLFYDFDANRTVTLFAQGNWGHSPRVLKVRSQPRSVATIAVPSPGTPFPLPRGSQESDVSTESNTEIVLDYTDENHQDFVSKGWLHRSEQQVEMGPNLQMRMGSEGIVAQKEEIPEIPSAVFLSARHRTDLDEEVERFGEVELEGFGDDIVACLKSVDTRIERLRTIASDAPTMIYADIGLSRPVPMGFLGDGIGRLLSMSLAFHQARNGMILIDEIENGLHHSVLVDVWKNLDWLSCKFNVQVIATTHSRECLVAARDAFIEAENQELRVHRLTRRDGEIVATTYTFEALDFTLDYGAEVR